MVPADDVQVFAFDAGKVLGVLHGVDQVFGHDLDAVLFYLPARRYRHRRHGNGGPVLGDYFLQREENRTGVLARRSASSTDRPASVTHLADEQSGDFLFLGEQRQVVAHQQHLVRDEHLDQLLVRLSVRHGGRRSPDDAGSIRVGLRSEKLARAADGARGRICGDGSGPLSGLRRSVREVSSRVKSVNVRLENENRDGRPMETDQCSCVRYDVRCCCVITITSFLVVITARSARAD